MNFPFAQHWHIYVLFSLLILCLTSVDLLQRKKKHSPGLWSIIWIGLGLVIGLGIYEYSLFHSLKVLPQEAAYEMAKQHALEYYAGYLVEKTLAIDNIFVFLLIFTSLKIPAIKQQHVLFWGILGALIFRAIFIALGAVLLQYTWVIWLFGALIFLSGLKLLLTKESPQSTSQWLTRLSNTLPLTHNTNTSKFILREEGKLKATPLLLALIVIEVSDIIFALDSVPAIFALTHEPLIVFTSNISAVMGLRAMYFFLAKFVEQFHLLRYGLAATLLFIGLKMCWLNPLYDGHFPITWSLLIISLCIAASIVASLLIPPQKGNHS